METSFQAWKYAKGLYLIPLFMVFNDAIILGGLLLLVLWNGRSPSLRWAGSRRCLGKATALAPPL
ncbi:MAG: hypothetical protein R3D80_12545 [Paracoccaceae bacterium]